MRLETKFAEARLHEWAEWAAKIVNALGYSNKNHIVTIGLPANPSTKQMGDLHDLPIVLSKPDIARLDYAIKQMPESWQTMIKIKYIGRTEKTEEQYRKEMNQSKSKYWNEWTQIYLTVNKVA